jgi:hypothetical protein
VTLNILSVLNRKIRTANLLLHLQEALPTDK